MIFDATVKSPFTGALIHSPTYLMSLRSQATQRNSFISDSTLGNPVKDLNAATGIRESPFGVYCGCRLSMSTGLKTSLFRARLVTVYKYIKQNCKSTRPGQIYCFDLLQSDLNVVFGFIRW